MTAYDCHSEPAPDVTAAAHCIGLWLLSHSGEFTFPRTLLHQQLVWWTQHGKHEEYKVNVVVDQPQLGTQLLDVYWNEHVARSTQTSHISRRVSIH